MDLVIPQNFEMTTFYDKLIKTTFEEEYKDEITHPKDLLKMFPDNGDLRGRRLKYVEHREKVDMERASIPDTRNDNHQSQNLLNFKISGIIFGTCLVIIGIFYQAFSLEGLWSKIQAPFVWYFTERYPIFVANLKNATQQVLTGTIQNIIEEQMLNIFPRN